MEQPLPIYGTVVMVWFVAIVTNLRWWNFFRRNRGCPRSTGLRPPRADEAGQTKENVR